VIGVNVVSFGTLLYLAGIFADGGDLIGVAACVAAATWAGYNAGQHARRLFGRSR
jgi:hypothetical protein